MMRKVAPRPSFPHLIGAPVSPGQPCGIVFFLATTVRGGAALIKGAHKKKAEHEARPSPTGRYEDGAERRVFIIRISQTASHNQGAGT
ncbi:MAG: hypothetical protein AAFU86_02350, partial [Pseudomonadota bacterium]